MLAARADSLIEQATPSSSPTPEDPPVHLAISDGVGGWSDVVDPSFFSQALMYHYAKSSLRTDEPRSILKSAYEGVLGEETVVAGSATACGVTVDSKGILRGVKWVSLLDNSSMTVFMDVKLRRLWVLDHTRFRGRL